MTIRWRWKCLAVAAVILATALGATLWGGSSPRATAQDDGDQCALLVEDAVAQVQAACAGVERGQVCYGEPGVTVSASGIESVALDEPSISDLAGLNALSTAPADPEAGAWGVAVLKLPANLPADGTDAVTAVLYGGASITRAAPVAAADTSAAEGATLDVSNATNEPVNLRSGAGVAYGVVAQVPPGESMVADGRNEVGDWVRVQYNGAAAWVFARVIAWDGDLMALPVLSPDDVSSSAPAVESSPFQTFTLEGTASEACPAAEPGLLLQYTGEQPASLMINGVTLSFSDASLLVSAGANASLDVRVLNGTADVSAGGSTLRAGIGNAVAVALGGDDGLTASGAPALQASDTFDTASAPLDLLPGAMACVVTAPAGETNIALRVGPGEQRGPIARMNPNQGYTVIGWTNDPEGNPWWQLDTGDQKTWVARSAVSAVGACADIAQVEAPPMVFAAPSAPTGGEDGEVPMSVADDLAPDGNSVWQMIPGSDNMSGECSGAPAINFCDHLAAIQPAQGGIMWKGMEASPYYLQQIQPNVYAYAGPNVIGTGTVSMTLTFTAENTLRMTQTLTLASEPNCQHTYYYSGSRNW